MLENIESLKLEIIKNNLSAFIHRYENKIYLVVKMTETDLIEVEINENQIVEFI